MTVVAEIFAALGGPPAGSPAETFSTSLIPSFPRFRAARDTALRPALLISGCAVLASHTPTELRNFAFLPAADCMLDEGPERRVLTILRCKSVDPALQVWFVRLLDVYVDVLGEDPRCEDVLRVANELVQLFHALNTPPRGTLLGLWGELALIACSAAPASLLEAWRSEVDAIYDFAHRMDRLEIKTTSEAVRRHYFSLEQLTPPAGIQAVVVSIVVDERGNGLTVSELVDAISRRLEGNPRLVLRVHTLVANTLGASWQEVDRQRFSLRQGAGSFVFIRAEDVPCVSRELPAEVSRVRFAVDLSSVAPSDIATLGVASELPRWVGRVTSL